MRGDDAEGPGTRGRLGEARRETANSMVALALAGEAQTNGARRCCCVLWLRRTRRRWRGRFCTRGNRAKRLADARVHGGRKGGNREVWRWLTVPESERMRRLGFRAPACNSDGLAPRFSEETEGNGCGGHWLYSPGCGVGGRCLIRANLGEQLTGAFPIWG